MIPQINIHQTFGQISIRYKPEQLNITSPPDDLTIQNSRVDLSIHTIPSKLSIDQSQAFADEGLRAPLAFSQYEAAKAHQAAENGTASTAMWGQRFLHIEKVNPSKQYFSRNENKPVKLVPALVPSPFSVQISYQPGTVSIHATVSPVKVNVATQPVRVSLTPTEAQTYIAQQASLNIAPPSLGEVSAAQFELYA